MKSIVDEIYRAMVDEKKELSDSQILQEFFKIDFDNSRVAEKIVGPLLSGDSRFKQTRDRTWVAVRSVSVEELPLEEVPFVLFYIEDIEKVRRPERLRSGDLFDLVREYSSFLLYTGGAVDFDFDVERSLKRLERYVFVPYDRKSLGFLRRLYRIISPLEPEIKTLSVRALMANLFPGKNLKTWDDITREFGLRSVQSERPSSKTKTLLYILEHLLETARGKTIDSAGSLMGLARREKKEVDFSRYAFDRDFLSDIPELPGVYSFSDSSGRLLYVGKTGNLKLRINSYFWNTGESIEKIAGILHDLHRVEYRVLGSDLEALIEEHRLIAAHRPPFNRMVNIPERELSIPDTILLLPSKMEGYIKLYVLSERLPLVDQDFDCRGGDQGIDELMARLSKPADAVFDPLKIIALFYLRRYEERLNRLDLDRFATARDVVNAVRMYCRDAADIAGERRTYL
jgi:hypothetical protein